MTAHELHTQEGGGRSLPSYAQDGHTRSESFGSTDASRLGRKGAALAADAAKSQKGRGRSGLTASGDSATESQMSTTALAFGIKERRQWTNRENAFVQITVGLQTNRNC